MNLMFQTTVKDGLTYIAPVPQGHWLYRVRDAMSRLGRLIDNLFLS